MIHILFVDEENIDLITVRSLNALRKADGVILSNLKQQTKVTIADTCGLPLLPIPGSEYMILTRKLNYSNETKVILVKSNLDQDSLADDIEMIKESAPGHQIIIEPWVLAG